MGKRLAWIALVLGLCGAAPAQQPAANPALTASARGVRDAEHARDLALKRFDVVLTLRGAVSETVVTATFDNRSADVLEGDFRLAMPAGAVVTGYALDLGGRLVDGVLVDQPKAKAVYEAQVRRRVDPGLAEVAPEGEFRTRVFPIPAGGARTIRVTFVAPLGRDGYRLPLAIDAPGEGWSVKVDASGLAASPTLLMPDGRQGRWLPGAFAVDASGKGALDGALVVGGVTTPDVLVSRHRLGERFVQLSGALPAQPRAGPVAATGGTLRVLWDRSRSRRDDRHEAEFAVLRRTIAALRPRTIEVVTFASDGVVRQQAASADAAIELLRGVRYRGATSFAGVDDGVPIDRCLLFSDGRVTIDRAARFAPRCRLDAVTVAPLADLAWLRHLAAATGGQAYALGEDAERVTHAIAAAVPGVTGVSDEDGNAVAFVPLPAAEGQWRVVARAPAAGAVRVRVGGEEVRRSLDAAAAFDGDGALVAADTLATLGDTDRRADYVATSRRYGIASPSLSFLVLETPADYIAADIAPPANYPSEQLSLYLEQRKARDGERADAKRQRFDRVARDWKEQVAWWKRRFDPSARPPVKRREPRDPVMVSPAPVMAPPPPPPPPAPPPPPPGMATNAPAMEADAGSDMIVTGTRVEPRGPSIAIDAWQPEREYLKAYDAAPAKFDQRFAAAEQQAGGVPAFYLDTAEWLRKHGRMADAVQTVLSALDLRAANAVTLGIVADRLERYGALDRAIELRERQVVLDPDRPQPKRLLALALAARAKARPATAKADLTRAAALLREVALTPWDERWDGVDLIALMEANALLPKLAALGGRNPLEPALTALLDSDIRVVVDWTTDATDLDLWVDEPSGERAIYNHPRTATGGHLSNDMTQGYGPEEYFLHRARHGTYIVRANVYAPDRLDPNGLSLVTAHLFRDWGRASERVESVDIEVARDERGEKMVGRIVMPGGAK